jgi:6-phosphofructokinase 1
MPKKTIAVLTGGGDCPGLNAAIRAIVRTAILDHDCRAIGVLNGYEGLIKGEKRDLSFDDVSNILPLGGTMLGTSNKASLYEPRDVSDTAVKNLKKWGVDTLFCIGGDGTFAIAGRFLKKWPRMIGVPKTIDNDLKATDQTIGFDTACSFVTEAVDRLHSTAASHHRVMVIEVMGRYAGWVALNGGLAGGGDVILIPEIPFSLEKVAHAIEERKRRGKRASIIVVAEGAHPAGGKRVVQGYVKDSPDPIRLGGIGKFIADAVQEKTGLESRVTVLGHLQRGGSPTFVDRMLATGFGVAAVQLMAEKKFGKIVVLRGRQILGVDIAEATGGQRLVEPTSLLVRTAGSLGVSFGI